jgi:hypothetical protein
MNKIKLNTYKEVATFLLEEKDVMHSLIVNSVKEAWKNKLDVVCVIEFHINDDIIKINIPEHKYKRSLEIALSYYEEVENYEKCMEINLLMHDIQEI